MTAILDLNDVALRLWHRDDCIHSPGYAWFDGNSYRFGTPALRTSRRTPRAVNTRFWSQLSTQALTPALGPARHTADLAHSHLQNLHEAAGRPEQIMLAAPGSISREQLSLLLGIIQSLPFEVAGILHRSSALAAASDLTRGTHIELQLHQMVLTHFESSESRLVSGESQTLPGQGLLALQDRLATSVASLFVSQTRFDPLRSAEGEQQLYDNLLDLITSVRTNGESRVSIEGYEARITRDDLVSVGRDLVATLSPLLEGETPLLLEFPLALLPGLEFERSVCAIDSEELATLVAEQMETLRQPANALAFNRSIERSQHPVTTGGTASHREESAAPAAPEQAPQPPPEPAPTHVLEDSRAYPLSAGLELAPGVAIAGAAGAYEVLVAEGRSIQVNSQAQAGRITLRAGDTIEDNQGFRGTAIVVED